MRDKNKFWTFLVLLETYKLLFYDVIVYSECQLETNRHFNIPGFSVYYKGANLNNFMAW